MTDKPVLPYDSRVNPYFPHQVVMETTSACQLRCKMCAREESLKKGTLKIGQMEGWLAEKIIEEVASVNPKTRLWFLFARRWTFEDFTMETPVFLQSPAGFPAPSACSPERPHR